MYLACWTERILTSKLFCLFECLYFLGAKLQGGSRFHIQVDQQFLIFPPPDISGDRKVRFIYTLSLFTLCTLTYCFDLIFLYQSWVRGPLADAELRECVSSTYYYFQTQAVKMKNISSDNDICAIVV